MPPIPSLSEVTEPDRPRRPLRRFRAASIRVTPPYDLRRTLECGQVFRWTLHGDDAVGIFQGRRWTVRQDGDLLRAGRDGVSSGRRHLAPLWHHLAADVPLRGIEGALARDPVLRRILPHTRGIAIMRQDPWECLISFVISAFNNIPKIRLSVEHLCRCFGEGLPGEGYAFPTAARLADARLPALRACILGYRAPYVRAVARAVADGGVELSRLASLPYDEARGVLLALPGVGEKVADCVLLFSLGHHEAFPVDVWVQRGVQRAYFRSRRLTPGAIGSWARDRFGPLAGYANQHLFLAARSGSM
jgi:N-glycosylase/DNA lyase